MSVNNPPTARPPTSSVPPPPARQALLSALADQIRSLGGTALLALSSGEHPVLYVRGRDGRTVPVVLVQGITGGWWFIWGRTGWADSSQVGWVAAALVAPEIPPAPATASRFPGAFRAAGTHRRPVRTNRVTARRDLLAGAA